MTMSAFGDTMLELLNVESAYGPIRAIRGVSLKVRKGEISTVLGSNGAGKTTILKTISGIIDPRKGSVEFNGHDITARDPAQIVQLGLSHVPEAREVFPLLSGGQQQMLAISRALMAAPQLMLLDEPSLGLSPKLTKEIFEIVVRINRERGTTILLVEQNANMALNAGDYGYVLENGRIVMEDRCAVLREKEDIKEFYLGMKDAGVRGERRWKKTKTWR